MPLLVIVSPTVSSNVIAVIGMLVVLLCLSTSVGHAFVSSDHRSVPSICSVAFVRLEAYTPPMSRYVVFGTFSTSPGASAASAAFIFFVLSSASLVVESHAFQNVFWHGTAPASA